MILCQFVRYVYLGKDCLKYRFQNYIFIYYVIILENLILKLCVKIGKQYVIYGFVRFFYFQGINLYLEVMEKIFIEGYFWYFIR